MNINDDTLFIIPIILKLSHIGQTGRSPKACKLLNFYNLRFIIILEENVTELLD